MSNFNQKEYIKNYRADKLKRVPLDMQLADYERLKQAATEAGQAVNAYIKQAIKERLERGN